MTSQRDSEGNKIYQLHINRENGDRLTIDVRFSQTWEDYSPEFAVLNSAGPLRDCLTNLCATFRDYQILLQSPAYREAVALLETLNKKAPD